MWVRDHRAAVGGKPKLGLPYAGPATIVGKVGAGNREVAYRIRDQRGRERVVHHNHLKSVVEPKRDMGSQPAGADHVGDAGKMPSTALAPPLTHRSALGAGGGHDLTMTDDEIAFLLSSVAPGGRGQEAPVSTPQIPYVTRAGREPKQVQKYQSREWRSNRRP